jgi:alpha-beta hydrolase superfamily lysophospholipase
VLEYDETVSGHQQKEIVSATPIIDQAPTASSLKSAQPIYFSSGTHRLFGWMHAVADNAAPTMGLVICKPFGFEAMSSHLSVRAFAEAAAEAGIPALRFDYGGAGDSQDLEPAADQVDQWLQDVIAAVHELQRQTGVVRICLLGIRLGALLAVLAAARLAQIQALIAIAPVISGKRYLRELRTFELAAAQALAALPGPAQQTNSRDADLAGEGHLEVSGFFLNAKTITALQNLDISTMRLPNVRKALVIDRQDLPVAVAWEHMLAESGTQSRYEALPGYVEMLMRPPNLTAVPEGMVAAARNWLAGLEPAAASAVSRPLRSVSEALVPALNLASDAGGTLIERPTILRPDPLLFGIVTLPAQGEIRRRGVILLNSGGDHHIGPRRLHVSLAREWAKHGYTVLRLDLSGLGDSAARRGHPRNEVFPVDAIDDIRAAVELMRNRYGLRDITLAGICSGASHAVRAGMEGVAINRVLAINPLIFFWKDGVDVSDIQSWEVVHKPAAYLGRIWSLDSWRRLLFGDVSIWRVARIYIHRPLLAMNSFFRDVARAMHIRLKNDLGSELRDLKARGVRVVFVFSRGDAGMGLLQMQSGLSEKRLSELYCIRMIDGADHDFTRSRARAALGQTLSEELYAQDRGVTHAAANDPGSFDGSRAAAVGVVAPPPKHR